MKIILPLLLFISYSFSYSQNTYVPDDNFEQFLIDSGFDSGPLNDYIPTTNINSLKELSISGNANYIWEIKSLEGIEDFIALEKLTIALNEVVTIDLSNSPNLKELYITSDALLENLNISNNIKLENFHCIVTSINSIDLSNNINIKDLAIGNSSIIDLDLSNNGNLERVEITHGIIENINLNNNNNTKINQASFEGLFNLKCIRVDNENYSKTNWTQIDDNSVFSETCGNFQQLTYVPDDNFEQELINLGYDSGPLDDYVLTSNIDTIERLDIENKNISDMTGIQDFVSLTYLDCSDNYFLKIDVNKLTKIETLICGAGNLNDLDITNNILIKFLSVNDSKLSSINLTNNINLEHLVIYGNNLSVLDISKNHKLRLLGCSSNNLTQLDTSYNPDLYWLDIYFNKITSLDTSKNLKLARLDCFNNSIKELNLINNKELTFLNCRNNNLINVDLRNNNNHKISSNNFDLRYNPSLTCVLVDDVNYSKTNWTKIEDIAIYKLNCDPPKLTYVPDDNFEQELINLGYDSGSLDDYVLTENIKHIDILNIENKNIKDLTGIQDFESLSYLNCSNNTLTKLDFSGNLRLYRLECFNNELNLLNLNKNTNLTYLTALKNKLTNIDLTKNINLKQCILSDNFLSKLDVSKNLKLTNLTLNNNLLTTLNTLNNSELKEFQCMNNKLEIINLSNNNKLEYLFISKNLLKNIDITNNIVLNQFLCSENKITNINIENNTELTIFICESNYINKLNLSTNINLNTLFVANNNISELNLTNNIKLNYLGCSNNLLSNLDITNNINLDKLGANNNYKLKTVDLRNNNNINFTILNLKNNNNLSCVFVDDKKFSDTYWLNTKDSHTNFYDKEIDCKNSTSEIIIPNFFTPNNDGNNDTWVVNANNNLIKYIYITDRFGKIVGKIKPNTIGWNGLYNGKQLPSNTYWYQIIFTNSEIKNGSFALIRN